MAVRLQDNEASSIACVHRMRHERACKPVLRALAAEVITEAGKWKLTIVTAESCTAGTLATLLADTPRAGEVLEDTWPIRRPGTPLCSAFSANLIHSEKGPGEGSDVLHILNFASLKNTLQRRPAPTVDQLSDTVAPNHGL